MSRRRYTGRDVVCPYFLREEEKTMLCAGCEPGMRVRVMFRNVPQKREYTGIFCRTYEWRGCPYAQAAEIGESVREKET